MRLWVAAAGVVVLASMAGCGGDTPPADTPGSGSIATIGTASTSPVEETTPPTPDLTYAQLRDAVVATSAIRVDGYDSGVQLSGGVWTSSSDGVQIELLEPHAIGDLDGDGDKDAVGAVRADAGGTGHFYTLVVWLNDGGAPVLAATSALGDRNPVVELAIASRVVTVVYLTRTDDVPLAGVNIRRTATYELTATGSSFVETGHTDSPYTPS
jgi:hypothetical protein